MRERLTPQAQSHQPGGGGFVDVVDGIGRMRRSQNDVCRRHLVMKLRREHVAGDGHYHRTMQNEGAGGAEAVEKKTADFHRNAPTHGKNREGEKHEKDDGGRIDRRGKGGADARDADPSAGDARIFGDRDMRKARDRSQDQRRRRRVRIQNDPVADQSAAESNAHRQQRPNRPAQLEQSAHVMHETRGQRHRDRHAEHGQNVFDK